MRTRHLLLEAALGCGNMQSTGRQIRRAILSGVEPGEMLSDDLVGCITFEALGAWVPARNIPSWVEHIDCVIDDRLNEQTVAVISICGRFDGLGCPYVLVVQGAEAHLFI